MHDGSHRRHERRDHLLGLLVDGDGARLARERRDLAIPLVEGGRQLAIGGAHLGIGDLLAALSQRDEGPDVVRDRAREYHAQDGCPRDRPYDDDDRHDVRIDVGKDRFRQEQRADEQQDGWQDREKERNEDAEPEAGPRHCAQDRGVAGGPELSR